MARQEIQTGLAANDGTGDSLRSGAGKVNSNFNEVYNAIGDGTSIKISVDNAVNGQVLAFNGTGFVPTTSSSTAYNSIQGDTGTASAAPGSTTFAVVGGTGITTSVSGNVVTINGSSGGGGGGASVTVSTTPPVSPADGDLWYDSELGILAVWYSTESVWVQTNGSGVIETYNGTGGSGGSGSSTFVGLTDTPSSMSASANKILAVNATGTAIEFIDNTGGTGGSGGQSLSNVTITSTDSPYNVASNTLVFTNTTSGAITINLPTNPSSGDEVRFLDIGGTFATNNLTLSSSQHFIQGVAESMVVDVDYAGSSLVYVNTSVGWLLKEK